MGRSAHHACSLPRPTPLSNAHAQHVADNLLGAPALLRVQLQNAFNKYAWNIAYCPGFSQFPPRTGLAYLTVDF